MAQDGQQRQQPRWLPIPGLAIAGGWATIQGASGSGMDDFIPTLLWPGTVLYILTTVTTYLIYQRISG